jgi:tetratricopeptide (TPR) repeat protein
VLTFLHSLIKYKSMYIYSRRSSRPDAGSIFFIIVFILASGFLGYLAYAQRDRFWDILPLVCIPAIIISLILVVVNYIRKTNVSWFFILYFILSITGLILSNFFGPNALNSKAETNYENNNYEQSISLYETLLDNYPDSWFADEAFEKLPYAYFLINDYSKAIEYFNMSINSGILDGEKLEIKNVLEECYIKVAEKHSREKEHKLAAENYLNAVKILEEIKNNFPNTNEAFISINKIPEFLYMASLNLNRAKSPDESIELLKKITGIYKESEYLHDASYLLSNIYINKAINFVENNDYQKGIEEFLKILDLEALSYDYDSINDYQKNFLISNIPLDILKTAAKENYYSGNYKKTIFLCELIIDYDPRLEEDINYLLIESKINTISSSIHYLLEQTNPERTFWGPGKSILMIENDTDSDLTIYLHGPEYRIIRTEKNSVTETEIMAGIYEAALESSNKDITPSYGKVTYNEGQKYREEYKFTK